MTVLRKMIANVTYVNCFLICVVVCQNILIFFYLIWLNRYQITYLPNKKFLINYLLCYKTRKNTDSLFVNKMTARYATRLGEFSSILFSLPMFVKLQVLYIYWERNLVTIFLILLRFMIFCCSACSSV